MDQEDDLIPGSRIHKRQRRDQLKDNAEEGSSSKDSVIFRKPFRGYAETPKGSIVTAPPILGKRSPFQSSAEGLEAIQGWRRGFQGL